MPNLNIIVPLAAQPQGSKKGFVIKGRAVLVESSKNLKANRKIFSELITAEAYKNKWVRAEKNTPVTIETIFFIARPKTVKREFMTVKPDGDKLQRFIFDAITDAQNVWEDDSQVTKAIFEKRYAEENSVEIRVQVG